MSVREVTMYLAACDWPGCDASAQDGTDVYALNDPDLAVECADDAGWRMGRDGTGLHYCPEHPATWASDHENGEPFPDPPYLLIHDGDLDDNTDDGNVTLVAAEAVSDDH